MVEKLQFEATMKDSASPAARKLRKELEGIRATPGMHEATTWLVKVTEGAEGFVKSGTNAAGIINAMGIGGLTAAASMATLVAQFKELGERNLAMKELGRETGLTVDQVNALSHAGQHFGVGADTMQSALNHLTGQMPEFRRGLGSMFQELSRWPELIAKLKKEGTEDQIKDIFTFLGQEKFQAEPQLQKQVLESIFGSGDQMEKLFANGAKGFLDELEKQKRSLSPITPEMLKQSQDFRDSIIDFNKALENFETSAGPTFLKQLTSIVKESKDFFDGLAGRTKPGEKPGEKSAGATLGEAARDDWNNNPINPDKVLPKLWDWLSKATEDAPKNLEHKSSYDGSAGLLHKASFGGQGSGGLGGAFGLEGVIASGTKTGVLAAFREMLIQQDLEKDRKPKKGLQQASYEDGDNSGDDGSYGIGRRSARGSAPRRGTHEPSVDGTDAAPRSFGKTSPSFTGKAPAIMDRLKGDFGLTTEEAAAVLGNLGHESAGFKAFKEGGGGPGRGWAQWTERGRKARFFDYASKHGLDPRSDEANYGFLRWELQHTHKGAIDALKRAHGSEEKMRAFEQTFEGAGVKAYGSRSRYMHDALRAYQSSRRATGLNDGGQAGHVPTQPGGHIRADIHVHGSPHKTSIKSSGPIEANLHRWPTMTEASDNA